MGNPNILPLADRFNLVKQKQLTIRLHDHGLMRLIPIASDEDLFNQTHKIFFHSLINSIVYKGMFFDHFSQKSDDKHGPFLLNTIEPKDFTLVGNKKFKEEIIQLVSSPKWSCPPITKEKLTDVKDLLNHLLTDESQCYFLEKCLTFNSSSQEAIVYEHEWSHSLTSYYEYVIRDPERNKVFLLIITYE